MEIRVRQHEGALRPSRHRRRRREQAVVGPHEHTVAACHLDGDGPARRTDARVHHGDDDTRRHVLDRAGERERTPAHVERRHTVGDVGDAHVRRDVDDHALQHADELVVESVVGEQRDVTVHAAHDKGAAPAREKTKGPVPTPRRHRPFRRCSLLSATPGSGCPFPVTWVTEYIRRSPGRNFPGGFFGRSSDPFPHCGRRPRGPLCEPSHEVRPARTRPARQRSCRSAR